MSIFKTVLTFFSVLECFSAFDIPKDTCLSDLYLNDHHYNVSGTYQIVSNAQPTDAHYDKFGNLFFVESGHNDEGFFFNAYMVAPQGNVPDQIPGLPEDVTYSIAIDRKNAKVYFGTGRGVYMYNYEFHYAVPVTSNMQVDMISIDTEGHKYISEPKVGEQEIFLLDGDKKTRLNTLDALNELTIDDKNNFYYIKEKQLCILKSSLSNPVCIGNLSGDGIAQIAVHNELVFVAKDDLLYIHQNETGDLKVLNKTPDNVTAIAFDKSGDFILGVPGKI